MMRILFRTKLDFYSENYVVPRPRWKGTFYFLSNSLAPITSFHPPIPGQYLKVTKRQDQTMKKRKVHSNVS